MTGLLKLEALLVDLMSNEQQTEDTFERNRPFAVGAFPVEIANSIVFEFCVQEFVCDLAYGPTRQRGTLAAFCEEYYPTPAQEETNREREAWYRKILGPRTPRSLEYSAIYDSLFRRIEQRICADYGSVQSAHRIYAKRLEERRGAFLERLFAASLSGTVDWHVTLKTHSFETRLLELTVGEQHEVAEEYFRRFAHFFPEDIREESASWKAENLRSTLRKHSQRVRSWSEATRAHTLEAPHAKAPTP